MDTQRIINGLVYLLIASILLVEHFARLLPGGIGRIITWLPEFISAAFMLLFFLHLGRKKSIDLGNKYIFIFFLLIIEFLLGIVINFVQPGAIFAGLRTYFKYIPFFLLPLVYTFEKKQIIIFLKFILVLSVVQLPIALIQRFILYPHLATGDVVTGALLNSGVLSMYLLCIMSALFVFILKGKINKIFGLIIMAILFFPMTINETKGAFLILPFSLLIPVYITVNKKYRAKYMIASSVLVFILMGVFSIIYTQQSGGSTNLISFFTEGGVSKHLFHGVKGGELEEPSRLDSINWAFTELAKNPMSLLVGLGIGNVGASFSTVLSGEFMEKYEGYGVAVTTFSYLLWEVGLLGILVILIFFTNIIIDSYSIKNMDGFVGMFAGIWVCVTILIIFSFLYKNLIHANSISCLFWMFSGYVLSLKYGNNQTDPRSY